MAANDNALTHALSELAEHSEGKLAFEVIKPAALANELALSVKRSSGNNIFKFVQRQEAGSDQVYYAYTLLGKDRQASRAEALAKTLAVDEGQLFHHNAILLCWDYVSERILAVSAIKLFGKFAVETVTALPSYNETAKFSVTPNFEGQKISMYVEVGPTDTWLCPLSSLSLESLNGFLNRVASETSTTASEVPVILTAIKARLNQQPLNSGGSIGSQLGGRPTASNVSGRSGQKTDPDIKIPSRLWRMIQTSVWASKAVVLIGPPGTGKTALLRKIVKELLPEIVKEVGRNHANEPLWTTPEDSWTFRDLVGGDTIVEGEIVFRPGLVLRSIEEKRWLIIDELNRADMDRIFGGLLTWLSGGSVTVGAETGKPSALRIELDWKEGDDLVEEDSEARRYLAGESWRLLGAYNALDAQRVFRLGIALGRRFAGVPIPALGLEAFEAVLKEQAGKLDAAFQANINDLYAVHHEMEITRYGPALFLPMCRYLETALALNGSPFDSATESSISAAGVIPQEKAVSITLSGHPESELPFLSVPASINVGSAAGPVLSETLLDTNLVETTSETTFSGSITGAFRRELLAEAYVAHIGQRLARLEEPDWMSLKERIIKAGIFLPNDLDWISEMVLAFA